MPIKIPAPRGSIVRGFAAGALTARALPLAWLTAGWQLSALYGAGAGEVFVMLTFVLGCAVIITCRSGDDAKIGRGRALPLLCAAIYAVTCALMRDYSLAPMPIMYTVGCAADILLICAAMLIPAFGRCGIYLALAMLPLHLAARMLIPCDVRLAAVMSALAAAALCGNAIICITRGERVSGIAMLMGMTAAMACDLII